MSTIRHSEYRSDGRLPPDPLIRSVGATAPQVAIKSEHFLRSFFQAPAASALPAVPPMGKGKPTMMPPMCRRRGAVFLRRFSSV